MIRDSSIRKLRERAVAIDLAVYDGVCAVCGDAQYFEFVISSDEDDRSAILDAGQWLISAERMASAVPAQLEGLDRNGLIRARINLERAATALREALKFVPSDQDRVPYEALFSPEGRALYDGEPGRFRRVRIEAVLAIYEHALRAFE